MNDRRRTVLLGAVVALAIFAVMGLTIAATEPWQGSAEPTSDANDLGAVVDSLFGPNVIAFEVLGVLLTAAMIGALVIARPLDAPADASNYVKPTPEQTAETDRVSDVRQANMEGKP
jgi:hypothetical protein